MPHQAYDLACFVVVVVVVFSCFAYNQIRSIQPYFNCYGICFLCTCHVSILVCMLSFRWKAVQECRGMQQRCLTVHQETVIVEIIFSSQERHTLFIKTPWHSATCLNSFKNQYDSYA